MFMSPIWRYGAQPRPMSHRCSGSATRRPPAASATPHKEQQRRDAEAGGPGQRERAGPSVLHRSLLPCTSLTDASPFDLELEFAIGRGESHRVSYAHATSRTVMLSRPPSALAASIGARQALSSRDLRSKVWGSGVAAARSHALPVQRCGRESVRSLPRQARGSGRRRRADKGSRAARHARRSPARPSAACQWRG